MHTDQSHIETWYSSNNLFDTLLKALEKTGIRKEQITYENIAAVDEFHVRGREVSRELAISAPIQRGMRVLDAGCGPGGTCRMLAHEFGCDVTGIDITSEYVHTAEQLSILTGLQHATRFVQGNALDLPFAGHSFDVVFTQHVQMNIADKSTFYSAIKRVLTPTGRFIYYDVLSKDHLPIYYPVPWASDASLNFLITSAELQHLLQQAGFTSIQVSDETEKGIAFLNNLLNRIAQKGLPPAGVHLLMGNNAVEKLNNLYQNLVEGKVVLESGIYCRR